MSPKLKKVIIAVVVFLLAGVLSLVSVTMLGDLSTVTVFDLRIVDAVTEEEVFQKEVYLTALSQNNFKVKVKTDSSAILPVVVTSSNTEVATVSQKDDVYTIEYIKAGESTISVLTAESSNVKDSFVLTVRENVPSSFNLLDSQGNVIPTNEIDIFADDREYKFDFVAKRGTVSDGINLSKIVVVEDYNKEVFEDIYIDDVESKLVVKAKQNKNSTLEYITLQSKFTDENGEDITVETFDVSINVQGNYIKNIQLMLNEDPNFDSSANIYGSGDIKEGEQRLDYVFLSKTVNVLYAKIRVVYTNGEYEDVTDSQDAGASSINGTFTERDPSVGKYIKIFVPENFSSDGIEIKFTYKTEKEITLNFIYLGEESSSAYKNFEHNELYNAVVKDGKTYYEYQYWDYRFMRTDAITDKDGNIVAFASWDPTQAGGAGV